MDDNNDACGALAASAACLIGAVCVRFVINKPNKPNRSRPPSQYKRAAILRPLLSDMHTPWARILSCGTDDDFLVSLIFTTNLFLQRLLPYLEYERARCNYGSSYRTGPKTRGRRPQLRSVDILGIALWYLKSKGAEYTLCPIFGIIPPSLSAWLDYCLEV